MVIKLGDKSPAVKQIQAAFNVPITGMYDELTEAAVKNAQVKAGVTPDGVWKANELPLTFDPSQFFDLDIVQIQKRIGTKPDGFWGPKSIKQCQKYLRSLCLDNPWPSSRDVSKFYGKPGADLVTIQVEVDNLATYEAEGVAYIGGGRPQPVSRIRCHAKIADSLKAIISDISESQHAWILQHYAGCYNDRNMRGSTKRSLHSWGIAVDFWPKENGFTTQWPLVAKMPFEVIEIFSKHGWTSAGPFWGRDAMHFQATKP